MADKIMTGEMQKIPIGKLIPYVRNARTHSPEQIAKLRSSLREFGFINPILIDRDFNVIAGHGRLAAARDEGFTEVPCVYVDHLSEAQKKAYILADNRMAEDAGWDEEMPTTFPIRDSAPRNWPRCSAQTKRKRRMTIST